MKCRSLIVCLNLAGFKNKKASEMAYYFKWTYTTLIPGKLMNSVEKEESHIERLTHLTHKLSIVFFKVTIYKTEFCKYV